MISRLPSPVGQPALLLLSAIIVVMTTAQTDLPLRSPRTATDHTSRRPRFDLPLRYRIVEELPVGTAIADLVVDAGLKRKYGPDVLGELEYRLLQDPAPVPLAIGLRTGLLTTVGRIDRDELASCRDKTTCELTVDVTVRPAKYFQVIKVTIEIADVNDNEPRFRDQQPTSGTATSPSAAVTVEVRESASPGTSFALPVAIDADGPEYGVQTYELVKLTTDAADNTDDDLFTLDIVDRPHDQLVPRLVIRRSPDRERQAEHRFRLIAYDGGRPPKSGSVEIHIRVMDSNDNSPVFDSPGSSYEANVTENVAIGTAIVRVRATDADEGTNAEVVYRFSAHTISTYGSLFAIDNRTGEITVIGQLDRERHAVYQLTVIAQDLGPDSMPVDAAVVVRVVDVNDNVPLIAVNTLQRSPSSPGLGTSSIGQQRAPVGGGGSSASDVTVVAEVPENLAVGTFVGHVSVSDEDSGDYGRVECNMTETAAFSLIRRGRMSTEYQIMTAQPLDRELRDRYDPLITCWDGGRPPLTSTVRLTVRVGDVNDNRPRFGQPSYSTRVAENSPPGTVVLRLSAADLDIGVNADVHYALASPPISPTGDDTTPGYGSGSTREGPFRIDPDDGIITVAGSGQRSPIDRERYSSFSFAVLAIDHGAGVSLTGSTVVVISIDDVNDEIPVFSSNRYAFEVDENRPEAEVVGTAMASDGDATRPNSLVGYRLEFDESDEAANSEAEQLFLVDPETGIIRTTMPLDREHRDAYRFAIVATDRGRPPLSATARIEVRVRDLNDNSPIFVSGDDEEGHGEENAVVVVSGFAPTGSTVTRVLAHDDDEAENGRVRYRIITQKRRQLFTATHEFSERSELSDDFETDERFTIDPDTGDVAVAADFPELLRNGVEALDFILTIRATDCGLPARWAETEVRLVVNASVPYALSPDSASPAARWKPAASPLHVTIVICVVAASALATIILLVLIAVVRARNRRKVRRDRHRRPSVEDFRDRLTEARLALTSEASSPVVAAIMKDGICHPVNAVCVDEVLRSTAEAMPLKLSSVKLEAGSRCTSPFSRLPPPANATTTWAGSRHGGRFIAGNGGSELISSSERNLAAADRAKSLSTPVVQAVIMACTGVSAPENERDSQHSSGEASNADSGRGHSSCCGDELTDDSFATCRMLHHQWQPHGGASNGTTGTCCVSGPTSRMIHYLPPPPPPPRIASYCPAAAGQHRGNGWSTTPATAFKSVLAAHNEVLECCPAGTQHCDQATPDIAPKLSRPLQSPLSSPLWRATGAGPRRPLQTILPTTDSRSNVDGSSGCYDTRSAAAGRQQNGNGNGISVVWNASKNGVVV